MRQAKAIVGLAGAILLIGSAPAGADVTPVGMWPFNEGKGTAAYDYSGHHNDGTLEGLAGWAPGRFQDGLNFNGNAAAVRVSDSPSLDPASVSVSAWVNSSTSPGSYKYILAKGGNGCIAASYGLYTGANGGLEFYVSTGQGTSYTVSPDAGQSVWDGKWHNVIGTYDGSSIRLYVDGQQVGSGTADSAPIGYGLPGSNELTIGDYPSCPSQNLDFSGSIDEVKLFNRALAPTEIAVGYQLSRAVLPSLPFDLIF
jgi:Concanavalin A-like lectin/glucanases superfamily